jgi:hypothetical protein
MKYLPLILCLMMMAFPAAAKADAVRLERLNLIFEGNESGSAYVRHCMKGQPGKASTQFVKNMILTTESLMKEMQVEYPALTNDQTIEALGKKQTQMKGPLDDFYKKNGCKTKQAIAAKKHFTTFNTMSEADMQGFLDNIENE